MVAQPIPAAAASKKARHIFIGLARWPRRAGHFRRTGAYTAPASWSNRAAERSRLPDELSQPYFALCSINYRVRWPAILPRKPGWTTRCCLRRCPMRTHRSIRSRSCSDYWAHCRTSRSFPPRTKFRWSGLVTALTGRLGFPTIVRRSTSLLAPRPVTQLPEVQQSTQISSYASLVFAGLSPTRRAP
jgi:hypothetical protein